MEIPIVGHYDAMTMELSFKNYSEKVARLREHRLHMLTVMVAQQNEDPVGGQIVTTSVKHVLRVIPKSASGGAVAPASPGDMTVVFSVRYWATYIDNKKVDEIDQLNRVDIVNGVDYNAAIRKALGTPVIVPAFSGAYLIRMAAKACTERIGSDAFELMPLADYNKIRSAARSFLLTSE